MDRTERFHHIDRLLRAHRAVSMHRLVKTLGASRATINRDIEYLRDRLNAPIIYDRALRGYRYDQVPGEPPFALPGLWFNADEIHALLTCHRLLAEIQPGLLDPHVRPLQERLRKVLEKTDHSWEEVTRRVRILPHSTRRVQPDHFTTATSALLSRKRLRLHYHGRARAEATDREVSPQRLVHYRDNWYLDAWCHLRKDLRSFTLDAIHSASKLDQVALDLPESELDAHFASAYGIFAGPATHTAILRFTPERARWVADEHWHPDQHGAWLPDGRYELRIPYSDPRELIMDILKYGPDVEVIGPDELRREVAVRLQRSADHYGKRE
ncbi:MAG: YafY family protein [Pseudomonadota bacterium]